MSLRLARRGMTLVSTLVVITLLGFLVAVFLPSVQNAREAARRNECFCRMKQLGLALLNHHNVHKRFPATSNQGNDSGVASVWWPKPGSGEANGAIPSAGYTFEATATAGYSWIVMILPYLDQQALYDSISKASGEFTADAFTPYDVEGRRGGAGTGQVFSVTTTSGGMTASKHFAAVVLDSLICPSYSGSRTVAPSAYQGTPAGNPPAAYGYPAGSAQLGSPPAVAAITNYVALAATHFPLMQYGMEPYLAATTEIPEGVEAPNGMIVPGKGLNMKATTDGTSKTLMVCETVEPAMNCWYDGTAAWTTGINPNTVGDYPPSKANPGPNGIANPQGMWMVPSGGTTAVNIGPAPVNSIAYSPALAGYSATPQVISWGPSSNHAGGVVTHLAVDGSVHSITPDIEPNVYFHTITRAGREPDSLPDTNCQRWEMPAAAGVSFASIPLAR